MSLVSFILEGGSIWSDGLGIPLNTTQISMLSTKMRSGEENIVATITNPGDTSFTVTIRNPSGIFDYWRLGHDAIGFQDRNNYDAGSGWGSHIPNIFTGALFECTVTSLFWNTIKNTREE